jgi:hypothetical protein
MSLAVGLCPSFRRAFSLLALWSCSSGVPLASSSQGQLTDGSAVGDAGMATAADAGGPDVDDNSDLLESSAVLGSEDAAASINDGSEPQDAEPPPAEAADSGACPTSPVAGDFPLDVAAVLRAKCQTCHRSPPVSHAPFPLLNYEQVIVSFAGPAGAIPRWQRMQYVIQPGSVPHMPLGAAPPLTNAEKQTLDAWFAGCATPVPEGTGGDVDSDAAPAMDASAK